MSYRYAQQNEELNVLSSIIENKKLTDWDDECQSELVLLMSLVTRLANQPSETELINYQIVVPLIVQCISAKANLLDKTRKMVDMKFKHRLALGGEESYKKEVNKAVTQIFSTISEEVPEETWLRILQKLPQKLGVSSGD